MKVVLAYSGGLDTSVAIRWINEKYNLEVIALTVDVGNEKDFEVVRQKALRTGAIKAFVVDAKDTFVHDFVFPALQAGRRNRTCTRWRPPSPDPSSPNSWSITPDRKALAMWPTGAPARATTRSASTSR